MAHDLCTQVKALNGLEANGDLGFGPFALSPCQCYDLSHVHKPSFVKKDLHVRIHHVLPVLDHGDGSVARQPSSVALVSSSPQSS